MKIKRNHEITQIAGNYKEKAYQEIRGAVGRISVYQSIKKNFTEVHRRGAKEIKKVMKPQMHADKRK